MRNPVSAVRVRILDRLADLAMLQDRIRDRVERRSDEKLTPRLAEIDKVINARVQEILLDAIAGVRTEAGDAAFQKSDEEWLTELINKGQSSIAYEIYAKQRRTHRGEIRGVAA